jgi:nucleoside-diphosphate-sugar epimerase
LRDELGWRPRVQLDKGLRETVNWWRERGRHAA